MKKITILFFMLAALLSKAQVQCIQCYNQNARVLTYSNNLILNGGFENTTCIPTYAFCPNSLGYVCDISNWTCTGGGSDTYACIWDSSVASSYNLTIIVEGNNVAYFGNSFCNTCSPDLSDTSCITNSGCEVTGIPAGYPYNDSTYGGTSGISLAQTVTGLTPSSHYVLEFWVGGEYENTFHYDGLFAIDIGFGNIFLRNPPTPTVTGIGRRFVIFFTATSSSHTFKFTNWGHIGGPNNGTELVLDDVQLYSVNGEDVPCAVSINEPDKSSYVNIYPNPVSDKLDITINTNDNSEITLYDISSRKLLSQEFIGSSTINIEHLSGGMYFYEIRNKSGIIKTGKVIKE